MLNKIVTDLETSKKLKELGIEMETKFYWEEDLYNESVSVGCWFEMPTDSAPHYKYTACFTLEQIIELLPETYEYCGNIEYLEVNNKKIGYDAYYERGGCDEEYLGFMMLEREDYYNINLATLAAKLLIKLKQD